MNDSNFLLAAKALAEHAAEILPYTPCKLDSIAHWLVNHGIFSNDAKALLALISLSQKFPGTMVLEKEVTGYYLVFYHHRELSTISGKFGNTDTRDENEDSLPSLTAETTMISRLRSDLLALTFGNSAGEDLAIQEVKNQLGNVHVTEICDSPSLGKCIANGSDCSHKIHFDRHASPHGEHSDCSYLDTCFKGRQCRFVHYKTVFPEESGNPKMIESNEEIMDIQYINANILEFDLGLLGGDYAAMIIDPPWDIHTRPGELGGCTDTEVMELPVEKLQSEGVVFLWVTGRLLEYGRQCLEKWGYDHVEELIWLKTNQLGKTICTGRTGHWLNHTKEHALVGMKGMPISKARQMLDTDVIVSNALGRSQKPEELYGIIDRLVGRNAKKLELFGRKTNIRPGWLTIGSELGSTHITDPLLQQRLRTAIRK